MDHKSRTEGENHSATKQRQQQANTTCRKLESKNRHESFQPQTKTNLPTSASDDTNSMMFGVTAMVNVWLVKVHATLGCKEEAKRPQLDGFRV